MSDDRNLLRTQFAQRPQSELNPRLDWFRDARFGMFVHWGLYAIPAGTWQGTRTPHAGEWIMHDLKIPAADYRQLAASFDPSDFDATALVDLAVETGQRYLVLTAKHHDGFCLWGTKLTDFNSLTGSPAGSDIVGEISAACRDRGLPFGIYYSQTQDWTHPDAAGNTWDFDEQDKDFADYLDAYVKPQLTELLTDYGPVSLIWFDTPQQISAEQSEDLVAHVHSLQPECLVNGRVGNGLGDYGQTADNEMPVEAPGDWETPITGNDTWGYVSDDDDWKPARDLVRSIAQAASQGGNVLLNVGPDSEGGIPEGQLVEFSAVGDWMTRCGRAVYGSQRGPFQSLAWGWSTERDGRVYLFVRDWPSGSELILAQARSVGRASVLTQGEPIPLRTRSEGGAVALELAGVTPDPLLTVIEVHDVVGAGS